MSESKPLEINDEIDLKELFLALWRGKYVIFLITVLAVVFASLHLRSSERKYSVKVVLKPVIEEASGPNLSGFSGLASVAGISLPTSSGSDFTTYQKLIFSEEVAERVFTNEELVVKLFKSEWNPNTGYFEAPQGGKISKLKQFVKSLLTGEEKSKYISPNPKRLSMLMNVKLAILVEQDTGFISISTETSEPAVMIKLISQASQETDDLLKERFFVTAEETLEFYYQKLLISRSPEHRESLAKLISAQDQKLMLASKSSNFVAEALTKPRVSFYPSSPKSSRVLILGFFLGFFFGSAIVIVMAAFSKLRNK